MTLELLTRNLTTGYSVSTARITPLEINVYMHVVTTKDDGKRVTNRTLSNQVDVLNSAYEPHGITFKLIDSDYTVNEDWATGLGDPEMMAALHQGSYADLNIYYVSKMKENKIGVCPYPESIGAITPIDGCIVALGTLPGGGAKNYDAGGTSTHEVGHWFGLLHVFEGFQCSGDGDLISDTPLQKIASKGCDTEQDSCPDVEGLDNVHNYMDYSYDSCYTTFTPGQADRMYQLWDKFRAPYKKD